MIAAPRTGEALDRPVGGPLRLAKMCRGEDWRGSAAARARQATLGGARDERRGCAAGRRRAAVPARRTQGAGGRDPRRAARVTRPVPHQPVVCTRPVSARVVVPKVPLPTSQLRIGLPIRRHGRDGRFRVCRKSASYLPDIAARGGVRVDARREEGVPWPRTHVREQRSTRGKIKWRSLALAWRAAGRGTGARDGRLMSGPLFSSSIASWVRTLTVEADEGREGFVIGGRRGVSGQRGSPRPCSPELSLSSIACSCAVCGTRVMSR